MGTSKGMKKVWANPDHREKRLETRRKSRAEANGKKKEAFLAVFRETGVIKRAIEASGSSYSGYHHWMADDPEFAAKFTALKAVVEPSGRMAPGVKPAVPRDEESRRVAKERFLEAFTATGLIKLAVDESGVPASQHRAWLRDDPAYAWQFARIHEKTRLYAASYWVTRPRMKAKQKSFLDAISRGLSLPEARIEAGIGQRLHYYWAANDAEFAAELDQTWKSTWRSRPTTIELAVAAELSKRGITYDGPRTRIPGYKYDVDIFVPSLGLDIEADGAYWHDEEAFPGKRRKTAVMRSFAASGTTCCGYPRLR